MHIYYCENAYIYSYCICSDAIIRDMLSIQNKLAFYRQLLHKLVIYVVLNILYNIRRVCLFYTLHGPI